MFSWEKKQKQKERERERERAKKNTKHGRKFVRHHQFSLFTQHEGEKKNL